MLINLTSFSKALDFRSRDYFRQGLFLMPKKPYGYFHLPVGYNYNFFLLLFGLFAEEGEKILEY